MLGGRCREWRLEHGHTQQEIATAGGCSKALVSLFEHGKRKAPAVMRGFMSLGYPLTADDFTEYLGCWSGDPTEEQRKEVRRNE